ncbi:MAG: tRNA (N6-isopentenyl adenosine(37)-C2)-methylthiotransferase MiaB [Acidaminococcaceae bacterium]
MNKQKKYTIINYGCQMNAADSEHYAGQLCELGYVNTEDFHEADIIVINTCCVRESAEKKIHGKIGELKNLKAERPEQIICIAGCMAQKDGEKLIKKFPQIDLVLGTNHVNNFRAILQDFLRKKGTRINTDESKMPEEFEGECIRKSTFSAWIPIMYGCNNFCTYCIVPYVRGRERSRAKENIVREVEQAVAKGFKEFTLLGQNVNSYGKDQGKKDAFADLLQTVDAVPGVERVRYMTSHPRDMNEAVVKVVASSKHICDNFHIPVQSGSNKILKAMNRGYTKEKYLELVTTIRQYVPKAAITTDIIVGFPGETDEDFLETLDLVKTVGYDVAYTFVYSKRSGTPAANLTEQVPLTVKKERLNKLMEVQNAYSLKCNEALVGQVVEVLVEGPSHNNKNILSGRTSTNKLVLWPLGDTPYTLGQIQRIKIITAQTWLLKGQALL